MAIRCFGNSLCKPKRSLGGRRPPLYRLATVTLTPVSAGSTLPYPIPWYLIPLNVFYAITMIYILIKGDARSKEANESFTAKTGAKLYQPFHTRSSASHDSNKVIKKLVANLPELEYPYTVPDFVVPCGPIVRPAPPISESDPELTQWLARGPTVYINLGTRKSLFYVMSKSSLK